MTTDDELRRSCTRFLGGHGPTSPRAVLAGLLTDITDDTEPDRYGRGGPGAELEAQIAELLGKPAAVFLPTGTMAQQIALRVWCDRAGRPTVAFHPTCHLELHESRAYSHVHGLTARLVGDPHSLLTVDDLAAIREPLGALLLELPQREIGGLAPDWDDLVAQTSWAREHGVAVHLDGARLWECGPFYDRPYSEIAALFDSIYVSFYKGLGGLGGCCLAGPTDLVDEVRIWQHRQGGRAWTWWPYAVSARVGLREHLPRMATYVEHARAIAAALAEVPGVEVVPAVPPTPLLHLLFATTPDRFRERALALAADQGIWTWPRASATDSPTHVGVELYSGEATLGFGPDEVAAIVGTLAG
jgi:threonine aldolase